MDLLIKVIPNLRGNVMTKNLKEFAESTNDLSESLSPQFVNQLRTYYRSGRKYTFRDWLDVVGELIDTLN